MTLLMANARTPRDNWITAGLRVLAEGGVDAVRIESLARELGVTKGGFYGYFADRPALLGEMLDVWERDVTDTVIERTEADGGDARTRLGRLFRIAAYGDGVLTDITTDSAVRDWARRDPAVAERLRRVDNRRLAYLRALFGELFTDADEVEIRASLCFMVWVANRSLDLDHGSRDPAAFMAGIQRFLVA
ncbi:TetR family transcriptional regulator [Actinorhabdospora filicis]|uniref:TetR family transcriptional regulator n=1 Tax=Actinorhabdospora filicis TaxID=1785913 RepID=A0A9W6SMU5_9ACTN|nr:TetR/AcrR family transcriptional regulator [Actinorhabdospora filicis]GLZ79814.1 TetR family transcriptional regulator [Actinorhabdospora filicis]